MTKPPTGTFMLHFQPRLAQSGNGWEILISWPDGQTDIVDGLHSEAEADQWIEAELASWDYHQRKFAPDGEQKTPGPVDPLTFAIMVGLRRGLKFHGRLTRLASTDRVVTEAAEWEVAAAIVEHLHGANWRLEHQPPLTKSA